jgi:oxygen-independent coproporphyrinogen-3 oxidase
MYGIPLQTLESFENTIDKITSLSPEHISAYCLKIEENTPFGKMADKLVLPDEDEQYEMYKLCVNRLARAGYARYEISNFSKKGRESRHNLRYWLGEDYLGFGAAAHSYFEGERFSYLPNVADFARGGYMLSEREKIEDGERLTEFVMLRMRLAEGVLLEEFEKRFARSFYEEFPAVRRFEKTGHIINDGRSCRFSDEGFFISSYILSEMLDF